MSNYQKSLTRSNSQLFQYTPAVMRVGVILFYCKLFPFGVSTFSITSTDNSCNYNSNNGEKMTSLLSFPTSTSPIHCCCRVYFVPVANGLCNNLQHSATTQTKDPNNKPATAALKHSLSIHE
eukprot:m.65173 g.65173  ORF g.65173 m.65173 type:complete len:122 (+) comp11517_c1_seq4:1583-1948(+)